MLRPCRNLQLPAFPDQQFCQCPTPVPQESQSCPIWPRHDLDRPPPHLPELSLWFLLFYTFPGPGAFFQVHKSLRPPGLGFG